MNEHIENNKRIAKNTLFLTIRMFFVMVVSLYTSRVFLRVLGIEDYGISNVVSGFVSMFAFIKASLSNATQRFYNYEIGANGPQAVTNVYSTSLVIQLIIGVIIICVLETIGLWFLYNKMVIPNARFHIAFWLYQMATISCFFTIMQIPYFAAIMAYERMDFYALISILDAIIKLLFAFAIPYIPIDKLLLFGGFTLGVTLFTFLLNFIYCKKNFEFLNFQFPKKKSLFKKMLSFSGWNAFGSFSITFREQGLNLILNLFFGPAMNAARGISYQVTGAINGLVNTLSVAAQPQIMQSYAQGNQNRSIHLMYGISKLGYTLMFLMAVPVSLEIDYILSLWLGDTIPEYSRSFIRIVIMTSLVNTLTAQVSTMVHASGRMRNYQVFTSLFCLLVLPISYIYLKHNANPIMVFVIMFLIISINYIISLYILRTLVTFSIQHYTREVMFPILTASGVSIVFPYIIHHFIDFGGVRTILVILTSIVSIGVSFFYVALKREERNLFLKLFHYNK